MRYLLKLGFSLKGIGLLAGLLLTGVLHVPVAQAESAWAAFNRQLLTEYFALHPEIRLSQGDPNSVGPEHPCSSLFLTQESDWWQAQLRTARQFSAKELTTAERFDQARLLAYGQSRLHLLSGVARDSIEHWAPILDPEHWLDVLQDQPKNGISIYLSFLARQTECANQLQSTLRLPLSAAEQEWAHTLLSYYHSATMMDAPKAYATFSRAERRQLSEASKHAGDALLRLDNVIQQKTGAEAMQRLDEKAMLAFLQTHEGFTVSLNTLRAIAQTELLSAQGRLRQLCAKFAPNRSTVDCVELARDAAPTAGVIDLAELLVNRARQTIDSQQLMTLPPGAAVSVGKGVSFRRDWLVYLHRPGIFSTARNAQLLVTAPAMDWSESERREHFRHRTSLSVTIAHEVWPGHYLQVLHALQQPSSLGAMLVWTSHHEGWACYSEALLFDGSNDYEAINGQIVHLQIELVRIVRLQALLGLHVEGWSRSQAEQRYRDIALLAPASASYEALRSAVSPQAGMYLLGYWYITRLREAWTATRGGRAAWREFHDRFLAYGAAPLPLIAHEMLGEQAAAKLLAE